MTEHARSLDGWWLSDGKREFWMPHADAVVVARAVIAEEMRQAIAEDKARHAPQIEKEASPAGFVGAGATCVGGEGETPHTARKIDARAFQDGAP